MGGVKDYMTVITPLLAVFVGGITAAFGLQSYRLNSRTKTAEFLLKLHQAFFVDATYKEVRQKLDDDSQAAGLEDLVQEEGAAPTVFLNFFELVAYMRERKDISDRDANALFGYYLQVLRTALPIRGYIRRKDKGFYFLNRLLNEGQSNQGRIDA